MPILKTCSTPGCSRLTTSGKCDECKKQQGDGHHGWRSDKARGTRTQRGYGNDWLRLRKKKLQVNPACEECWRRGFVVAADEVHHKIAFSGTQDPLRMDWDNLESLCESCHSKKTRARRGGG